MLSKHGKQWRRKNIAEGNQDSIFHQVTNEEGGRTDIKGEEASHEGEVQPGEEQEAADHGVIGKTPSRRSARANQEAEAADEVVEAEEEAEEAEEADHDHLHARMIGIPSGPREVRVEARRIATPARDDSRARARAGIVRRRQRGSMP